MDRRTFLTLPLLMLFARREAAGATALQDRQRYTADVGVLYDMLTFHLEGTIDETIDRKNGRYHVIIAGHGSSISNEIDAWGILAEKRWMPVHSRSWFNVRGRVSSTEIDYDYTRRVIEYHARAETFFLRRLRIVDDVLAIPSGIHLDDVISATLNYADQFWTPQDGILRTFVVRRRHATDEGPDDVAPTYGAEVVQLEARLSPELEQGKSVAMFDLSPFSSWIRPSRPARIVFGNNRRPELISSQMILGSSVTIRFGGI